MLDQISRILKKIFEDKKFVEIHTSYSENFNEYIRQNRKSHQRDVNKNGNSTT